MNEPTAQPPPSPPQCPPELLAPAGNRECIRAAVENGADAVYFGLESGFNARARAHNMSVDELPEIISELHARAVKGYVTFNTLVFPDELQRAESHLRRIAAAGVDAVLVQDLGVVRLIREVCPDLPIHASTQMTLTSSECIRAAEQLGIERVVLARELSVREIAKIRGQTAMELEVFVHGALCVAYSGQCLTSESLGGRSANRGQCAQACRLGYELTCDGQDVNLGPQKYLLSPQDLAAYELTPDLIRAGVCSFKIEGRLKTPEYVANITRHYRQAIDSAAAGRPIEFSDEEVREMELSFSRGFSPGWLNGCDHKMLVPALSSAKRGVLLGRVEGVRGRRVRVQLDAPVQAGDGVVFEGDRERDEEQGGRIYQVFSKGQPARETIERGVVELAFAKNAINFELLEPGLSVWKTDDPQLTKRLRKTFAGPDPARKVALDLTVDAEVGKPLTISGRAANGARCQVSSNEPLEVARRHKLTDELLNEQLSRLGGTIYELRSLDATIRGGPMVPLSVLGKLRRELNQQLTDTIPGPSSRRIADRSVLDELRAGHPSPDASETPRLRVLCRSLSQLETVLDAGATSLYVDFQDIREYKLAVPMARRRAAEIHLATPRIQKPDELGIFRVLERHAADGILVRNLAGLQYYSQRDVPVVADFSLNAANEIAVRYLAEQGAGRITASYDLNREQLLGLVDAAGSGRLEVVVHQHMPMFHMEHCVFCAVLSPGTDKTNCGRPCDDHLVQLRDRIGMEHPLKADVGCRNTLFNAVPQSAAEVVPTLIQRGVRSFRVELLDDSPKDARRVLHWYGELLAGRVTGKQVWSELKAANRVGVTRGTLEERRNPLAIL